MFVAILGSAEGVARAAAAGDGDVEILLAGLDHELGGSGGGMIVPGYVLQALPVYTLLMIVVLVISVIVCLRLLGIKARVCKSRYDL